MTPHYRNKEIRAEKKPPGIRRLCDEVGIELKAPCLFTGILQIRRTCNSWSRIARDRAQVLVDCSEVVVGHVLEEWPSHDLKKIAVDGWHVTAASSDAAGAIWVHVIEIRASPHDLDELLVGVATRRKPRLVGRQIAGIKVLN
jgi:hypothetical protein